MNFKTRNCRALSQAQALLSPRWLAHPPPSLHGSGRFGRRAGQGFGGAGNLSGEEEAEDDLAGDTQGVAVRGGWASKPRGKRTQREGRGHGEQGGGGEGRQRMTRKVTEVAKLGGQGRKTKTESIQSFRVRQTKGGKVESDLSA